MLLENSDQARTMILILTSQLEESSMIPLENFPNGGKSLSMFLLLLVLGLNYFVTIHTTLHQLKTFFVKPPLV